MTLQTTAPLTHLTLATYNKAARDTAHTVINEPDWIDTSPPYQRGAGKWTRDQQIALVRSWLTGLPVPAIILNDRTSPAWQAANGTNPNDTGVGLYAVVDGKQRIEATLAWFTGDLAVPASWFPADHIEQTTTTDDGPYVTYSGLTLRGQRLFANRAMLPVIEARVATVAEEADLYLLINGGGTPQTSEDLDNAAQYASEM